MPVNLRGKHLTFQNTYSTCQVPLLHFHSDNRALPFLLRSAQMCRSKHWQFSLCPVPQHFDHEPFFSAAVAARLPSSVKPHASPSMRSYCFSRLSYVHLGTIQPLTKAMTMNTARPNVPALSSFVRISSNLFSFLTLVSGPC